MNDNIPAYRSRFSGFIQQLPTETFLQITNCDSDIAFAGNLQAELINECQESVFTFDVNENFFYAERTDIHGKRQIAYEFGNIGIDFGQELLFLKLTHTVSENFWVSAAFIVTADNQEETTRFEYTAESYFRGISYDVAPYFQSIRLTCFKNDIDPESEGDEQVQMSGSKEYFRITTSPKDKYSFYTCDFFTYNRLVALLAHPIKYINNYRVAGSPQNLSKGERVEGSNIFTADFEVNPTEEYRASAYQLFQGLELLERVPANGGDFLLSEIDGHFSLSFNRNVSITPGAVVKLYKNDTLVATVTPTAAANVVSMDFSSYSFTDADYAIVIAPDQIYHGLEMFPGFEFGDWAFSIGAMITLTDVSQVLHDPDVRYTLAFNGNFTPDTLGFQYKIDPDADWSAVYDFSGVTSPQHYDFPDLLPLESIFRLSATLGASTILSNEFTY